MGGHKTKIVTDRFLHESGMAGQIQEILARSGVESIVFPGAEPNPTDKNVAVGVAAYRDNGCGSILSLGGGHYGHPDDLPLSAKAVANGNYMKARDKRLTPSIWPVLPSTTPLWAMSTPWHTSWRLP